MSGTRRIGAACDAACNAHDTRFSGFHALVFFRFCHAINTERKLWKAGLSALRGKPSR